MIKNGGYTMLDLAVATYKDAAQAFNVNKPIMVYDNSQVYYADTCVYDTDNDAYVLTKGGKTITIDSSNNVVSSGDIQNHFYWHICDIGEIGFGEEKYGYLFFNFYSSKSSYTFNELWDYLLSLELTDYNCINITGMNDLATAIAIQSLTETAMNVYLNDGVTIQILKTALENSFNKVQSVKLF